jgi:hypothetical protein
MRIFLLSVIAAVVSSAGPVPPVYSHAGHKRVDTHPEPSTVEPGRWEPPPSPEARAEQEPAVKDVPQRIAEEPPDGGVPTSFREIPHEAPPPEPHPSAKIEYVPTRPQRRGKAASSGDESPEDPGEHFPASSFQDEADEESSKMAANERALVSYFKKAVRDYLKKHAVKGIWTLEDNVAGRTLRLSFDRVDEETVWPQSHTKHFGCVYFTEGKRVYDVDFFINPRAKGELVEGVYVHRVNGRERFVYDADSKRIPGKETPLSDVRFNIEGILRRFVTRNSPEGYWLFQDGRRRRRLIWQGFKPGSLKRVGWESFAAEATFKEGARTFKIEFVVDYTDWSVSSYRIASLP